jgi:hypothetical protein
LRRATLALEETHRNLIWLNLEFPLFGSKLPRERVVSLLEHVSEGCGVRATSRLVGVHRDTVTHYTGAAGDYSETTILDLADDALLGIEYLKSHKEIDPTLIGVLGHSGGGVVGPIAASRSTDVAFLVMLVGLGQNNGDIIIFQKTLAARRHGADEDTLALMRFWYKRVHAVLAGIEQALKAGGNTQFTIREFPGLHHGFGPVEHDPEVGETMSPAVLQTISDWIVAETGTAPGTNR